MPRLAAIDIGSNAVRFTLASMSGDNQLKRVHSAREPIRLGADVFAGRPISTRNTRRLIEAFRKFGSMLERHHVRLVRAVATSAMREALNRDAVVERVWRETGFGIDVISGAEEARLVHLAVAERVPIHGKLALLIDIGGGSVEVTLSDDGIIVASESLRVGTVRLLEAAGDESILPTLVRESAPALKRMLAPWLAGRRIGIAVGTGGNIETLGRLRETVLGGNSGHVVRAEELAELIGVLSERSIAARVSELGLRTDRADVVLPAALVLQMILKHAGVNKLQVPRVGLKDGVLLDLCGQLWVRKTFIER